MGLNIQSSTMGYDTVGLQDLIKNIKIDIIPAMATSIRNSKNDVRDTINSVWVGASANAFKDKLDRDTEVLCKTLMDLTEAVENDVKTAGVNVEELDAEIAKMFGGTGAVASFSSTGGGVLDSFKNYANDKIDDVKTFVNKAYPIEAAANVLKRTGATVATAGFGLVEGIETFGEAILDTGAILGTGVATIFTGGYDLITGSDSTKQMWNSTKGFVSKKLVKDMADDLYANTGVGRWVKDNAYGFDLTRNISSGIGYVGGVVALTVATFGVGGAVAGGTAGTSAATSITAGQLATTAGVAGFGKGTQDAWADGAGTLQGLGYGAINGTWEAAQFYAGAKIAGFEGLSSSAANIGARVGMDTADSAVESFVQPAMQMIYKDKNYGELFDENGGWGGVATNAAIGALGSSIGEAGNLRSLLNKQTVPNLDLQPAAGNPYGKIGDFLSKFTKTNNNVAVRPELTMHQVDVVNQINTALKNGNNVLMNYKSSATLSTTMLDYVTDLDRVKFKIDSPFRDIDGNTMDWKYNTSNRQASVTYTGREVRAICDKLEHYQAQVDPNLPTLEKAKQIYEIIAKDNTYDYAACAKDTMTQAEKDAANFRYYNEAANLRGITNVNPVGERGLVCAGYAMTFQAMCERNGIKCDYVLGDAILSDGSTGYHAWNVILDDNGGLIPVDVTWHSGNTNQNWFGQSDEFSRSHVADSDELFSHYSTLSSPVYSTLDSINKYNNQGIAPIREYAQTGYVNPNLRGGSQTALSSISRANAQRYVNYHDMINVSNTINNKYGYDNYKKVLVEYLNTGNINLITRDNGARDIIRNMDKNYIIDYLNGVN